MLDVDPNYTLPVGVEAEISDLRRLWKDDAEDVPDDLLALQSHVAQLITLDDAQVEKLGEPDAESLLAGAVVHSGGLGVARPNERTLIRDTRPLEEVNPKLAAMWREEFEARFHKEALQEYEE
jgi:hypothetical protein